jgi:hypothetical protein
MKEVPIMPNRNLLMKSQRARQFYSALPRSGICVRAVHHVFKFKGETDEGSDDEEEASVAADSGSDGYSSLVTQTEFYGVRSCFQLKTS